MNDWFIEIHRKYYYTIIEIKIFVPSYYIFHNRPEIARHHAFLYEADKESTRDKVSGNMGALYSTFSSSSTINRLEPTLFSYPNELSPDSTTKNVCKICGKT